MAYVEIKGLALWRIGGRRFRGFFRWLLFVAIISAPLVYEMRTSALQSWLLSNYARKLSYQREAGPSPNILFPKYGPFDLRAGYARIPDFESRLGAAGYRITEQVRFSSDLERAVKWGIRPPYTEPISTKLTINGMDGRALFRAPVALYSFHSFEEIPPLAVNSLLIIENRELSEPADSRSNPVVDWNRLAMAALYYAGNKLGLALPVQGGSTLATQMEKFRHSNEGRTDSLLAKLRQMTDASLSVYQKGPDTREERRQIVLNYLNSIPLAAAPGYGEIHGIGEGLQVWFGLNLQEVRSHFALSDGSQDKVKAFKHVLALQCSVKAPSYYLLKNRKALEARTDYYVQLLADIQVISQEFAERVNSTPLEFSATRPARPHFSYAENKAMNDIRINLASQLGLPGLYELDRLHLEVESTIDPKLQTSTVRLFERLHDAQFIDTVGLRGERLLAKGDPSGLIYGMMLYEKTPTGNLLRVATDNLNAPFNINTGMKMQLGSTAKLRTLANYLDIAALLFSQLSPPDSQRTYDKTTTARDPITLWASETLSRNKNLDLAGFLQMALDRKYSASPSEIFFTGGGAHTFRNFDKQDNNRIVTVREATVRSVNLVYVRLMRDIVRYYEARLPYDAAAILTDMQHPERHRILQEIADEESEHFLRQAYKRFKNRSPEDVVSLLLDKNKKSDRHLTILFYAWSLGGSADSLDQWLERHLGPVNPERVQRLKKAYGNPRLNLADYGYLLDVHPLRIWCAGRLAQDPDAKWEQIRKNGAEARRIASAWLFKTRNRSAQDRRLRIRFERDAFVLISAQWKRLGFPFDQLVPSYATALGSSGDRPEALADLMGILLNEGVHKPSISITRLRFAGGTPYETVMEPDNRRGKQILHPEIARTILPVLAEVVQKGSAIRLSGAFNSGKRALVVGGKTGSGDNRVDSVGRRGQRISSRSIDRTAVFTFYIEDRYFGVMTALVPGKSAAEYGFTSSLPLAVLKLMAQDIEASMTDTPLVSPKDLALASRPSPFESQAITTRSDH